MNIYLNVMFFYSLFFVCVDFVNCNCSILLKKNLFQGSNSENVTEKPEELYKNLPSSFIVEKTNFHKKRPRFCYPFPLEKDEDVPSVSENNYHNLEIVILKQDEYECPKTPQLKPRMLDRSRVMKIHNGQSVDPEVGSQIDIQNLIKFTYEKSYLAIHALSTEHINSDEDAQ